LDRLKKAACFGGFLRGILRTAQISSRFESMVPAESHKPSRLHMKHVSDVTIYPLRMAALAVGAGLRRISFSYGRVSGLSGRESRTEHRVRSGCSWRDQRTKGSCGAGAAGRGDVMKVVLALVISSIVLVPGNVVLARTKPPQPGRVSVSY